MKCSWGIHIIIDKEDILNSVEETIEVEI